MQSKNSLVQKMLNPDLFLKDKIYKQSNTLPKYLNHLNNILSTGLPILWPCDPRSYMKWKEIMRMIQDDGL